MTVFSSHSFKTYLLSSSNRLGVVLWIRNEMVDKMALMEFTLQRGKMKLKKNDELTKCDELWWGERAEVIL